MGVVLAAPWAVSFYRRASNGAVRQMLDSALSVDCDEVAECMGAKPTKREVDKLREAYRDIPSETTSLYVADASLRFRTAGVVCEVASAGFPQGSFGRLPVGSFCPTPACVVVAMGSRLPVHFLVELACELAGSYRKDSRDVRGMVERNAVLALDQLCRYLDDASNMRGSKGARKAVPYVIEGSGSPMETTLFTLLCLGIRLGGAGLPKPEMNARIDLPPEQRASTGRSFLKADMLWRDKRLILEYDSDWAHGNSRSLNRDATRRNALQDLGYTVVTVTREQVFNWESFCALVSQIEKRLGKADRAKCDWSSKRFQVWRISRILRASGLRYERCRLLWRGWFECWS